MNQLTKSPTSGDAMDDFDSRLDRILDKWFDRILERREKRLVEQRNTTSSFHASSVDEFAVGCDNSVCCVPATATTDSIELIEAFSERVSLVASESTLATPMPPTCSTNGSSHNVDTQFSAATTINNSTSWLLATPTPAISPDFLPPVITLSSTPTAITTHATDLNIFCIHNMAEMSMSLEDMFDTTLASVVVSSTQLLMLFIDRKLQILMSTRCSAICVDNNLGVLASVFRPDMTPSIKIHGQVLRPAPWPSFKCHLGAGYPMGPCSATQVHGWVCALPAHSRPPDMTILTPSWFMSSMVSLTHTKDTHSRVELRPLPWPSFKCSQVSILWQLEQIMNHTEVPSVGITVQETSGDELLFGGAEIILLVWPLECLQSLQPELPWLTHVGIEVEERGLHLDIRMILQACHYSLRTHDYSCYYLATGDTTGFPASCLIWKLELKNLVVQKYNVKDFSERHICGPTASCLVLINFGAMGTGFLQIVQQLRSIELKGTRLSKVISVKWPSQQQHNSANLWNLSCWNGRRFLLLIHAFTGGFCGLKGTCCITTRSATNLQLEPATTLHFVSISGPDRCLIRICPSVLVTIVEAVDGVVQFNGGITSLESFWGEFVTGGTIMMFSTTAAMCKFQLQHSSDSATTGINQATHMRVTHRGGQGRCWGYNLGNEHNSYSSVRYSWGLLKIHAGKDVAINILGDLSLPWDPGVLGIFEDIHGEPNHSFGRQVLLAVPCNSLLDGVEFSFTSCGQAPFQGGKSITVLAAFIDHNYYLDVVLNQVPADHDYYLVLVRDNSDHSCRPEGYSGGIMEPQMAWDPGGNSTTTAWGQAVFQEGRGVSDLPSGGPAADQGPAHHRP